MAAHGVAAHGARSKSWSEFTGADSPAMDVIITVCDRAAAESCPVWPARDGRAPERLHWRIPDPAAAEGSDAARRTAFEAAFTGLRAHIDALLAERMIAGNH